MQYSQPASKAFRRALRQAYRVKHAKDKKRAIRTLCRSLQDLAGARDSANKVFSL